MPMLSHDDLRFDNGNVDILDDASSFVTVRSALAATESGDDFSLVDAESRSASATGHVPMADTIISRSPQGDSEQKERVQPGLPPSESTHPPDARPPGHAVITDAPDQLPELSHDTAIDGPCNECDEDQAGCSCLSKAETGLPRLKSDIFEPITPPNFEPLAPIDISPDFANNNSLHESSSVSSSVWEPGTSVSGLLSSKAPSVDDKLSGGLASPRMFDIEDLELKNDMLLTLRYLDSSADA